MPCLIVRIMAVTWIFLNGAIGTYTFAVAPHEYELLVSPGNMATQPSELQRACAQMRYDFRTEFARQHELREKIFQLFAAEEIDAPEVHRLTEQLKGVVARIQHLAKPEWHREIWPLRISWRVQRVDFYDESEDLDERRRIRNSPLRSLTAADLKKLRSPPVLRMDQLVIDASYFVGELHADVRQYLRSDVRSDPAGYVTIEYSKMATALELCQLLPSLQFAVTIQYRARPLGIEVRREKKFYLTYGSPLAGKRGYLNFKEWLWPQYSLLSLQ